MDGLTNDFKWSFDSNCGKNQPTITQSAHIATIQEAVIKMRNIQIQNLKNRFNDRQNNFQDYLTKINAIEKNPKLFALQEGYTAIGSDFHGDLFSLYGFLVQCGYLIPDNNQVLAYDSWNDKFLTTQAEIDNVLALEDTRRSLFEEILNLIQPESLLKLANFDFQETSTIALQIQENLRKSLYQDKNNQFITPENFTLSSEISKQLETLNDFFIALHDSKLTVTWLPGFTINPNFKGKIKLLGIISIEEKNLQCVLLWLIT